MGASEWRINDFLVSFVGPRCGQGLLVAAHSQRKVAPAAAFSRSRADEICALLFILISTSGWRSADEARGDSAAVQQASASHLRLILERERGEGRNIRRRIISDWRLIRDNGSTHQIYPANSLELLVSLSLKDFRHSRMLIIGLEEWTR